MATQLPIQLSSLDILSKELPGSMLRHDCEVGGLGILRWCGLHDVMMDM